VEPLLVYQVLKAPSFSETIINQKESIVDIEKLACILEEAKHIIIKGEQVVDLKRKNLIFHSANY